MSEDMRPKPPEGTRLAWNIFSRWAEVHAVGIETFPGVRKPPTGSHYFTPSGALWLLYYLPFGGFCMQWATDVIEWQVYLAFGFFSLIGLIAHRAARMQHEQRGIHVHSRFKGESRIGYAGEVLLCWAAGIGACFISAPLGAYLLLGGIALAFNHMLIEMRRKGIDKDRVDAEWEQEWMRGER